MTFPQDSYFALTHLLEVAILELLHAYKNFLLIFKKIL